jgi:aspartyl-tRNA synthetase
VGQQVRLGGWVHRRRDLGGIVFIDLRDRAGIVQVAIGPGAPEAVRRVAGGLSSETVVEVEGQVARRPANMTNPELATGEVEIQASALQVVGPAVTPAIPVARGKGEELPAEELRLRYRHLDLRRPEMQANLLLRHRLLQRARAPSGVGFVRTGVSICRSRRRSTSSCSWWRGSTATSRSPAASGTKTCATTASPSSARSISKRRS